MDFGQSIGRTMVVIGLIIVIIGLGFMFGSKIGIGRLPGDIFYKKGNFSFYFPIVTSIVLSLVLTILFNLFRFRR